MSGNLLFGIRIEAQPGGVAPAARQAKAELEGVGQAARAAGAGGQVAAAGTQVYAQAATQATSESRRLADAQSNLYSNAQRLGGMMRAAGLALGLRELFTAGADFDVLQRRIQGATRATGDYVSVSGELRRIADDTGTALESSVVLFQRTTTAAKDLGATNPELVRFTETVQKLAALSGTSASAQAAGTMQLAQMLSGEVARAEEFNSILENIPDVALAIADALGVSTSQLRRMMLEGRLLSRDVFEAILRQSAEVDARFERFGRTVQQAGQAAATSFGDSSAWLGRWTGGLALATSVLDGLASNMDLVVISAAALALWLGPRWIQNVAGPFVSSIVSATTGTAQFWATISRGEAVLLSSRAATQASVAAKLQYATASHTATQAELREAERRVAVAAQTSGYTQAVARLTAAKAAETAATAQLTAAQAAYAAATTRSSLAMRAWTAAGSVATAVGRGLLALFGGPLGLAVTGLTVGLLALSGGQSEAERAADAHTQAMERLERELAQVGRVAKETRDELQAGLNIDARQLEQQLQQAFATARSQVQEMLAFAQSSPATWESSGLIDLEPLINQALQSEEGIRRLQDALAALAAEDDAPAMVVYFYQALRDASAELWENRSRLEENAAGQALLAEAAGRAAGRFVELRAEIAAFNQTLAGGLAPLRERAAALAEQAEALGRGDLAAYDAITARQQAEEKAAATAKRALDDLQLGGVAATLAYNGLYGAALANEQQAQANAASAAELRKQQGELAKGFNATADAAERLREQQDQLVLSGQQAAQAEQLRYNATVQGAAAAQALETELETWEQLVSAKLVPAELSLADALDLINEATDERIVKIRDSARAAADWKEKTDAVTKAEREALAAEERLADERQALIERPFKNALDGIQSSFVDFFQKLYSGGVDSFEDLSKAALGIFTKLAAELTTLLVFQPSLLTGSGGLSGLLGSILPGSGAYGGGAGGGSGGFFGSILNAASSAGQWLSGAWDGAMHWLGLGAKPMTGLDGRLTGGGVTSSGAGAMTSGFGLGDLLGGAGIGSMAGGLLSMIGYGKSGVGTGLGGTVGGMAGAAIGSVIPGVGTILGSIIGGLGGGLLGGLFGARPSNNTAGLEMNFGSGESRRWDDKPSDENVQLTNWIGQQLSTFNQILETVLGQSSDATFSWWLGDRDGTWLSNYSTGQRQNFGDKSEASVQALTRAAAQQMVDSLEHVDATVAAMIKKSLDLRRTMEQVGQDIQVIAAVYPDLIPDAEALEGAAGALKEINDRWDEWATRARELGIAESRIAEGREKEITALREGLLKGWDQQILELTDPLGAALAELEDWRTQAIADATAVGEGMSKVEELYGLKRQQILEQYLGQANDSIQRILDDMAYGSSGGVAVGERLSGLRATVQAAGAQALAGDAEARQRVIDLVPELLRLSQQANAGSAEFYADRDFVRNLLEMLQVEAPGYADGTPSAARGLARVGERGPEWLLLRGGEQVIPNSTSRGWLGGGAANDDGLLRQMLGYLAGIEEGIAALARAQQRANRRQDLLEARLSRQANVQRAAA